MKTGRAIKKHTRDQRMQRMEKVATQMFLTLAEQQKMLEELADFIGYDLKTKDSLLSEIDDERQQ
jgi:hypothetical protein